MAALTHTTGSPLRLQLQLDRRRCELSLFRRDGLAGFRADVLGDGGLEVLHRALRDLQSASLHGGDLGQQPVVFLGQLFLRPQ